MVVCNFVIPFPLLAIKKLRTISGTVIASATIVVGMWLERFLIIVPPLSHKYLPYAWGTYRPTWVEIILTAGTFAAMALFYLLFAKFVPIISIWELKAGMRGAPAVPSPLRARTRTLPITAGPMTAGPMRADAGLGAADD
jgi:Ni/Fe-hydrogenase subunit HybB-like protein